jgi:hypothetical protein
MTDCERRHLVRIKRSNRLQRKIIEIFYPEVENQVLGNENRSIKQKMSQKCLIASFIFLLMTKNKNFMQILYLLFLHFVSTPLVVALL